MSKNFTKELIFGTHPAAESLAYRVLELIKADAALQEAWKRIPNYRVSTATKIMLEMNKNSGIERLMIYIMQLLDRDNPCNSDIPVQNGTYESTENNSRMV